MVDILAAGTTQVLLSLEGAEFTDGEEVTVRVTSADGLIAPIDSTAVLLSATQTMVVVELNAAFNAVNTPVTAMIDPNDYVPVGLSILPPNANFAMATVDAVITPREFTWVFEPPTELRVLAGDSAVVRLTLQAVEGSMLGESMLGEGEQVSVDLAFTDAASGLTLSPMPVTLTSEELSAEITVNASVMASGGNLMASARVMNASIPNAAIAVVIAARQLALVFNPMSVALDPENADTVVEISLGGDDINLLDENESVVVTLTADSGGVTIEPSTLTLRGSEATSVRIQVSADVGSRTLTATAAALTNADIADATLPVTISAPSREFALVFNPSLITIRAGDELSLEISIQSEEGSILLPSEEVVVDFAYNGAVVVPVEGVVLSADNLSTALSLELPLSAITGNLRASASLIGANIADGSVAVTIEPRAFSLVFRSASDIDGAGEPIIEANALANSSTEVRLSLEGASLVGDETVVVEVASRDNLIVSDDLIFSATTMSQLVRLDVSFEAASTAVFASVQASEIANANFAMGGLFMQVEDREFALAFRSADDTEKNGNPINEISILPGGSIEVLVSFDSIGESSLTSSESLQVRASVDADSGVTLDPSDGIIHLSSVQTTVLMTVQASVGAIPTVVSLSLVDGQGIENADIQSARLNVSIDRRLFNLSFDPTSLTLAAGSLEAIELRISGADLSDGERVAVDLTVLGNANVAVTVPVAFGDEPTQVVFIAPDTLTAVVNIDASEAMTVGSALVVAVVSAEDQQALGAEIELAQLAVTIEIVERELAIAFDPIEVRLNEAGTAQATLTLEGLLSDEQVRVNLNQFPEIPGVEIYDVVTDPELMNGLSNLTLTSANRSVLLELRNVDLDQPIALTASIDDAQAQALNAQVTSGVLQVLPQTQAGRVFSLAFDSNAFTLTTGESRTFAVLLNGPALLEGERVTAAVTVESDATIVVSDNPLEDSDEVNAVEFTNSVRRMNVTITAGQMPESLLVVAVVSDETRESVSDAQFSPATLQVLIEEVVDDRTFSLVFNPTSVTLTAGETAQVNISLVGAQLNIDESVEVTLASVGGGEVVMITPSSIVLTNLSSSATFEIAPQIGVQAQSLSIIASGAGVNVAVASLPVTIQLREFILAFDPASIELTVGTSADVNLLLEGGSLNVGEQLRVMLIGGAGIDVTPGQVIFAGGGPNMMPIQVSGVSVDLLGLGAEARAVANSEDAQTLSAQFTRPRLPVTVTPRSIGVRFDRAMVEIVRGGSANASGSAEVYVETDVGLLEGEAIEVSVFPHTASNLRANPGAVTLTAASSRVMVTLTGDEAAQSGVVTLVYLEGSQGLNNNIEVNTSEGRLQVEVVRGVNITFDPADELRIEANTPASVIVRTSVDLIEDEQVTVQLEVTGSGLSIVSNSGPITLNALMSTTVVEVSAVIAGELGDLTATATGEGVAVLTQVATLPVRVLRGVSLVFEIGTGEVVRGSSTALSVTTEPLLIAGEVVTARLTVGSSNGAEF